MNPMSIFDASAALRQPLTDPQKISRRHDIVPWLAARKVFKLREVAVFHARKSLVRQLRWRCWWVPTHSYETLRTATTSLFISCVLGMSRAIVILKLGVLDEFSC